MRKQWEIFWAQMTRTANALNDFQENGCLSSVSAQKSKPFIKEWDALKKQATDFDAYISPADPLEIVFPFKNEKTTEMWQRWKEYLSEQFGQAMRSRSEKSALEHLVEITKGDEDKAVRFLRYAMMKRYKNFFEVEEKDLKQPDKGDTGTGSDF